MAVNIVLANLARCQKNLILVLLVLSTSGLVAAQTGATANTMSAYDLLAAAATDAVALEFTNSAERVEIELPPPDPRVQMPECASALETSVGRHNGQGGRLNVRVDCRDAAPWARNMAVNVKVYREVLVLDRK